MNYKIKLFLLGLVLILKTGTAITQVTTGFEIVMHDDSLSIGPFLFVNEINGKGYIGLVNEQIKQEPHTVQTYVYHISENGNVSHINFLKQDSILIYNDIIPISYGEPGYLLSGTCRSIGNNNSSRFFILTRIDTSYNILWERLYNYPYNYTGYMRTIQTIDSGFLFCYTADTDDKMCLFKFSYYGDSLNYRNYNGITDSAGIINSITYNPDSTAIWLHTNLAHYSGGGLNSCIEIDGQLNQIKVYHYDNETPAPFPFTSKLLPNYRLLTGGTTWISHPEKTEKYISGYIYDTNFNVISKVFLTNPDTISRGGDVVAIDYCDPSCIYLAGTHNLQWSTGSEPSWFYVTKLNDTLGVEFEKYIGGDDYYWLSFVLATNDGGIMLAGTRSVLNSQMYNNDGYIIKLDSTGCIVSLPENKDIRIREAIVYPNPGQKTIHVRTALKHCNFYLYDMQGKQVIGGTLLNGITTFQSENLKKGAYLYSIIQNGKTVENGKWIKQ